MLEGAEIQNAMETDRNVFKIEKVGKMRTKGRLHAILGGGTSKEADLAEALELASS